MRSATRDDLNQVENHMRQPEGKDIGPDGSGEDTENDDEDSEYLEIDEEEPLINYKNQFPDIHLAIYVSRVTKCSLKRASRTQKCILITLYVYGSRLQ